MHDVPPLSDLDSPAVSANGHVPTIAISDIEDQRRAGKWVGRLTSIVGVCLLVVALVHWLIWPNHYRPVLALLTIAMFAAILHSYTFEDGS